MEHWQSDQKRWYSKFKLRQTYDRGTLARSHEPQIDGAPCVYDVVVGSLHTSQKISGFEVKTWYVRTAHGLVSLRSALIQAALRSRIFAG